MMFGESILFLHLSIGKTRGVSFGGDNGSGTIYNTIQYVNIPAGSGNSTDFGDLTSARDVVWELF